VIASPSSWERRYLGCKSGSAADMGASRGQNQRLSLCTVLYQYLYESVGNFGSKLAEIEGVDISRRKNPPKYSSHDISLASGRFSQERTLKQQGIG